MRYVLLVVLALLTCYVVAGFLTARRHRVPFGRVLALQWAALRRWLTVGTWLAMLLPPAWTVIAEGSSNALGDYLRSYWPLYVVGLGLLWLLRAWPFKAPPEGGRMAE